ncbi:TetR/AcrR family transcriptional regulator [Gordonia phthalatica]|uniref:TetR family transcriptional regulator n=1 Tax=Gordonia phthalatica TaxID=1136941 RepID=A0A0N9NHI0_9ACTN|nr:TetR/AcrR family transcriptional regulator [Gordonia phthalatica]ALG85238.1 TetR family transcriptional regulator [Gordonia phthalatica]
MTSRADTASTPRARKRPADRRDVILTTAARTFARDGFHAAHLSRIADEAGISAPALYRHFAGKYELFAAALLRQGEEVADTIDAVPADDDPRTEASAILRAVAGVALDRRDTGNIYRREPRMLEGDDRQRLAEMSGRGRARLVALVRRSRPSITDRTAQILVTAALSIIASPVTHRITLARRTALTALLDACTTVLDLDLPAPAAVVEPTGLTPLGKREAVLTESIRLFAAHSFHEVTMEQIGAAVNLPPSGVYRHFPSKTAILIAALWRGSERTTAAIADGLAHAATPVEAVDALARQYAGLCVADPDIMTVYLRDMSALDPDDRRALRRQQRLNVDEWASWLRRARPDLTPGTARFLVHAALNLATDVTVAHRDVDAATVGTICATVLRGPATLPGQGPEPLNP